MHPYQNTKGIFHRTSRNNHKIYTESKKAPNCQSNLSKKNNARGITLPDFKLYSKAAVISTVLAQNNRTLFWHRHIEQWNRIKSPKINICTHSQLVYDKGNKDI